MSTGFQKFALYTLGCKVNQEEGTALINVFLEHGWEQVDFSEIADLYIINTCTVTHLADRKSRQMLRRVIRQNPQALIVATGCYAQTGWQDIQQITGIDLIVGVNDRWRLWELVQENLGKQTRPVIQVSDSSKQLTFQELGNLNNTTERVRAFLKIEDGCSQFCSYCIIPHVRGPVRSKDFAKTLAEAGELIAQGYQEIVLTGIHTGAYGTDFPHGQHNLAGLAQALSNLPGMTGLRLGSIEPQEVTPELISVVANSANICPHFHIPLQSGSNGILQMMNRHYTIEYYQQLLNDIREAIPNVAITTDIIVGFPGETDADFDQAMRSINELGLSDIHVFPYSPRSGTPAATFPNQVGAEVKNRRAKAMQELAEHSRKAYWQQQLGLETQVLLEQSQHIAGRDAMVGHSPSYLPVAVAGNFAKGCIINGRVTIIDNGYLWLE